MTTCADAAGVAPAVDDDTPVPTSFVAETLKRYAVPLVSPVTVYDVDVLTPSDTVTQLPPLLLDLSMR